MEGKGTLKEFSALLGGKKIYFLCIILFCIREPGNEVIVREKKEKAL